MLTAGVDHRERLAGDEFHLCRLRGVSARILVCDDDEKVLAYIHRRARPFRVLLAVLVAAPMFFLVPLGLIGLFIVTAERFGIPAPGMLLSILFFMLALAAGFVASMFTAGLLVPRRRFKIWDDKSRRRLLLRVNETWKFGVARVRVSDADGEVVGRIFQHHRRRQYLLLDRHGQPLAVLSEKSRFESEWSAVSLLAVLGGIVGGLLFSRWIVVVPGRERTRSESFLYRVSSLEEDAVEIIGRIIFDPVREYPYHVELSGDPQRTVDRALVVALMGLLEW